MHQVQVPGTVAAHCQPRLPSLQPRGTRIRDESHRRFSWLHSTFFSRMCNKKCFHLVRTFDAMIFASYRSRDKCAAQMLSKDLN